MSYQFGRIKSQEVKTEVKFEVKTEDNKTETKHKLYLNIPYEKKNKAKEHYKTIWDVEKKLWYIELSFSEFRDNLEYYCQFYCPVDVMGFGCKNDLVLKKARSHHFHSLVKAKKNIKI